MKSKHTAEDVLERNVGTLLEAGGEAPRIADGARARIRAHLLAEYTAEAAPARRRLRSPLVAVGLGLAATMAGALAITNLVGGGDGDQVTASADDVGATWITDRGAEVVQVGPRHLRVTGAALIDVVPGRGTFTVDTSHGTIEVVGTRFYVAAESDRTTAAVVRGAVKLASSAGSVLLHAGEQGVVEQGRPPTRMPAPRLSHLVSWAEQARKQTSDVKPLRNGTLFAREPNNPWVPETPLPIAKLGVDVVVEDQVARVAIDQTFHNPNDRVMEGMYRFAIPPDAALQRLAMYVDGRLTESAVVQRMQARRIYEDVVYRRLDPALLEWNGAGRLALRVYPLPPQQDKRLLIAYTQSLPKLYDDYTLTVPLPEVDLPVGELDLDVRMKGCGNCELTSTSHKISVDRKGNDAVVHYRRGNVKLGDSLVLHVRDTRKRAIVATDHTGDGNFLLVRARPDLTTQPTAYKPRTWVILDDVSASRDASTRRAQTAVIDGFLRELDEDDRVSIVAFDVTARTKLEPTRVLDVDREAVHRALAREGDVGATDFGVALDAALAQLRGVDPDRAMIVYLGDGVISSGPRKLDKLRAKIVGKAQFVGVGIGDGPDTQTLGALAAATGGYATTMDLADDLGWRAFDLVAALHTARVTGLEGKLVDAAGQQVPATVYLGSPQLADGEELELVAKLAGDGTPVAAELTGTLDGRPWHQRVQLAAARDGAGYLPRLWAQRHIAARMLAKHEPVPVPPCTDEPVAKGKKQATAQTCKSERELREERDEEIRKEVVALGTKYFLLSRHTSLLVLENDAMYARYGVHKGAGDTWAPYVVPAKIAVNKKPTVTPDVASDAELVRRPLEIFYNPGYDNSGIVTRGGFGNEADWRWNAARTAGVLAYKARRESLRLWSGTGQGYGGGGTTSTTVARGPRAFDPAPDASKAADDKSAPEEGDVLAQPIQAEAQTGEEKRKFDSFDEDREQSVVFSDELGGETVLRGRGRSTGWSTIGDGRFGTIGGGKKAKAVGAYGWGGLALTARRLTYPTDTSFDDLTAFVPALVPDGADAWRRELTQRAGTKTHPIDDVAKQRLAAARAAMPAGVYRWGDYEIAVDAAHRIGWRHTTPADLAETASFDGTTWTRRYAELGIDVVREVGNDDVALALAYLPVWIAEPSHYARWFEVHARGAHEVTLSRPIAAHGGKRRTEVAYVLAFDDRDHLVAIRDAGGTDLVRVTWGASGPIAARVLGDDVELGFSGLPIADAVAWAHGTSSQPGVAIDAPMHLPAYWEAELKTLDPGSAKWRHVQRQRMASLAAINDRQHLFEAFEDLRTHGGVELGDLALASGGIATASTDPQLRTALAGYSDQPIAQYLQAGRTYGKNPQPAQMRPKTSAGFVGALWTLRETVALYRANQDTRAIDRLLSLGDRAPELRLAGVAATTSRYQMKAADIERAWDSVARGSYTNIARAQAAMLLARRGNYDEVAERVVSLIDRLDLDAAPPNLTQLQYQFQQSRRGQAGWQLLWATWRDKVLAGSSYEHVMSLLPLASAHPIDIPAIVTRAAALAGDDTDRIVAVARYAISSGQPSLGYGLLEPVVKQHPTRELHQLLGTFALQQGRKAEALDHFEAAQKLGGDEEVELSTLRTEMSQIVQVAGQLAVQAQGADRKRALERALAWGNKWRAIDPANPQIDQQLGQLMLEVGNTTEAWRYLSSVIERDPMSGAGYATVAQAFESQGRVAEAVPYWHQAVILDQTNPTHRMREAQALIALGKTAEGDAILRDVASHHWHERWSSVVYQVKSMLERAKQSR